jgi:hypothetical protein
VCSVDNGGKALAQRHGTRAEPEQNLTFNPYWNLQCRNCRRPFHYFEDYK